MENKLASRSILAMYALSFFFTLHLMLPVYVQSTFLGKFISEGSVGVLYTAASITALLVFVSMIGLLRRFGNYKVAQGVLALNFASLAGLILFDEPMLVFIAFIANFAAIAVSGFVFDIFLEHFSKDSVTGRIRGTYLTFANVAAVVSPLIAAWLLAEDNFERLYSASFLLLIPASAILFMRFRDFKDPEYAPEPFWHRFSSIWADRNIKAAFILHFLLHFFYAWMVVYTPIYLHDHIGFDWKTIGFMFSFMLLPFAILDLPLGRMADRHGEKKLLVVGFIVTAVATGAISVFTDHNPWIWGLVLFATRVGAATVEIMTETYFFKKVNSSKIYTISLYRAVRPLAYVIAPIVATILLVAVDVRSIFVVLGLIMLYGVRHALALEDTL